MRIDLHTHTNCSDGTDPPAALVRKAAAAGIDVLGLTDHDTFTGWPEALEEAYRSGVGLLPGAEISCRIGRIGVHLLAYLPDPTSAELDAELVRIREGRASRLPLMVELLQEEGLDITVADVAARLGPATAPGRPHVADALVAKGYVADRREAFDRWLAEGRSAYVGRYAPGPETAIRIVVAAGGVPVLAHPRGRGSRTLLTDDAIAGLAAVGLVGLEVDHHDHSEQTRSDLRSLARTLDLVVTGASDHHGTGKIDHELGLFTTAPAEFERLLDLARSNAAASGRDAPVAYLPGSHDRL